MRLIDKDALLESLKDLEASGGSKMYRKALDDALHYFFPKIIEEMMDEKNKRWYARTVGK